MNFFDIFQVLLFLLLVFVLVKPLGLYMAKVIGGERVFLSPVLGRLESYIYRFSGVAENDDMSWKKYAFSVLVFGFTGVLFLYALLRLQGMLPLNPDNQVGVSPHLAFNIAVSFVTNTNWQSYTGEVALSHLTQMVGLTVQNFISPAVGIAVMFAFIRGFIRKSSTGLGNFWVDVTRSILYILLPLALIIAAVLASQGVVQAYEGQFNIKLLEQIKLESGEVVEKQNVPLGPVASQIAIKQLGTNGGGFYGVNSAHPYENPTPLSNFVSLLAILLIPAALCYSFGYAVGDTRQGWMLLAVKALVFIPLVLFAVDQESRMNPIMEKYNIEADAGGNIEGKEVRFGYAASAIWSAATAATSNGSLNSNIDSYSPLGGMVPMMLIKFGEVIFGGIGSGIYGIVTFVIISVFISGLMVGRTPEYLGKKLGVFEIKMASLIILVPAIFSLVGAAIAVLVSAGVSAILNPGPHGLSEVVYAFSSAANNNGSAFAGLSANNVFYNTFLGICMLAGRFWIIVPVLAMAGSLGGKKRIPSTAGTLRTDTPLFAGMLIGVVMIVGFLTYIPTIVLGPVVEQLQISSLEQKHD